VVERDPSAYWMWLASRSAAIVAFVLIACSVTLGLFMANGLTRRPGLKRSLVKVHEQIALAALVAIVLHGVLLLGDKWLKPGFTGIAIPFSMSYRPLWTGLGIIGGYIAVIVGPTYFIRRRIGGRRWRQIHRTAAIVYVLGLIHALQSGTDGATLWFRTIAAVSAAPIVVLLALRYLRSAPKQAPRPSSGARSRSPASTNVT
jgi:methionine sulfoxide reductase heme-binding subunit